MTLYGYNLSWYLVNNDHDSVCAFRTIPVCCVVQGFHCTFIGKVLCHPIRY